MWLEYRLSVPKYAAVRGVGGGKFGIISTQKKKSLSFYATQKDFSFSESH